MKPLEGIRVLDLSHALSGPVAAPKPKLDDETLRGVNPGLIYASISGFGLRSAEAI